MDVDLWKLSAQELLRMVGRFVKVTFAEGQGSLLGVIYTFDPESRSLVLMTDFELKSSLSSFCLLKA